LNEGKRATRVIRGDEVSDVFQITLGKRTEEEPHSSPAAALPGQLAILPFQASQDRVCRLSGATLDTRANFAAKRFELGLAQQFLFLQQPKRVSNDLACAGIASAFDLALDELLEVIANGIAGWHVTDILSIFSTSC
jgi:hypothetical protein